MFSLLWGQCNKSWSCASDAEYHKGLPSGFSIIASDNIFKNQKCTMFDKNMFVIIIPSLMKKRELILQNKKLNIIETSASSSVKCLEPLFLFMWLLYFRAQIIYIKQKLATMITKGPHKVVHQIFVSFLTTSIRTKNVPRLIPISNQFFK